MPMIRFNQAAVQSINDPLTERINQSISKFNHKTLSDRSFSANRTASRDQMHPMSPGCHGPAPGVKPPSLLSSCVQSKRLQSGSTRGPCHPSHGYKSTTWALISWIKARIRKVKRSRQSTLIQGILQPHKIFLNGILSGLRIPCFVQWMKYRCL